MVEPRKDKNRFDEIIKIKAHDIRYVRRISIRRSAIEWKGNADMVFFVKPRIEKPGWG
jgi:hypothetical protein